MSFAAALSQRVAVKKQETKEREKEGQKWLEHESKLVDAAVELFKRRCTRAAENMQCQLSVSFEVLTREVPGFPTHAVKDSTYLVDSWGDAEPEMWFYARRGASEPFVHGLPIQFVEVLEGMMPQFLEKVKELGFKTCAREVGTWKVRVSWQTPQEAGLAIDAAPTNGQNGSAASSEEKNPKAKSRSRSRSSSSAPVAKRSPTRSKSKSKSPTEVPSGTEVPTTDAEA